MHRFIDEEYIADRTTPEVQRFILERMKRGYAWETASHMRHFLGKVLGTAKDWQYVPDNSVFGAEVPERTLKRHRRSLSIEEELGEELAWIIRIGAARPPAS